MLTREDVRILLMQALAKGIGGLQPHEKDKLTNDQLVQIDRALTD